MKKLLLIALLAVAPALATPGAAAASSSIRYGVQDDAWLASGPGTVSERVERLQRLGVQIVRYTVRWDQVARTAPASPGSPADAAYDWRIPDSVLRSLHEAGIEALVTLYGTPRWANGGGAPNVAPSSRTALAAFARATALRYPWVRRWLDAYATNPYPLNPRSETPWSGGCRSCRTFTMANLPMLLADVQRFFPGKRVWLTEYGYQTNPPDRYLGVPPALQARYLAEAGLRAYLAPRVDMLINFLVRDEPDVGRWQSGLLSIGGVAKPAYYAFSLPLAELSRHGTAVVLWGQVRPGSGRRVYVLQRLVSGHWRIEGGVARTDSRGFLRRTVHAAPGARFRLVSPSLDLTSPALPVT